MKNTIKLIGLIFLVAAFCFAVTSCPSPEGEGVSVHTHDWNRSVTTPATCTTEGVETRWCAYSTCKAEETRSIPIDPDGHKWTMLTGTPSTCTTEGNGTRVCAHNQAHTEVGILRIDPKAHNWGEWITESMPFTSFTLIKETITCVHNAGHEDTRLITLEQYLSYLPDNTAAAPYTITLNVKSLIGTSYGGSEHYLRNMLGNKYVNLDLSGSTFTVIGVNSFYSCTNLTGIIIPNSVTSIGEFAFWRCTNLTSVTIPNSVTIIMRGAFQYSGLTSVTIPNSVTSIEGAFSDCHSLTSVTIGNSVASIGSNAFAHCRLLTSVTIPNSVTSIGSGAFVDTGLVSVTIPKSVTQIEDRAFVISSLTSVTFEGTIPSGGFGNAFGTSGISGYQGDLRDKFYATDKTNGTPGTYTRPNGSSLVWTKM